MNNVPENQIALFWIVKIFFNLLFNAEIHASIPSQRKKKTDLDNCFVFSRYFDRLISPRWKTMIRRTPS